MNVLGIGGDSTLAMDKNRVTGDSQDRHIEYGKYLSNLFIIVPSPKRMKSKVRKLSENVTVYPTPSQGFRFIWDSYRIGRKICRENKIDVITTQSPLLTGLVGYLLKRKFGIPLNVQLHGDYLNNEFWLEESKLNYFLNMLGNFIIKKADSIRVVSNRIKEKLVKQLNIPYNDIFVLPIFTNISRFTENLPKINLREKYSGFKYIVLFIGALSKTKNVDVLLKAAAEIVKKHPETLFLIVGVGEEKKRLTNLTIQLGLEQNVKFEGAVPYEYIPSYYHSCDLLVLPSKHEGWGRVIIEALACGRPVVLSDTCGSVEFVANAKCGLSFPPNRPDILAEKIVYLLQNSEVRAEMGNRGRTYVKETMDIKKNAYKYRDLYEKTIELSKRKQT